MSRTKVFDENAVLDKAVKLFWEKGFLATSAEDLVSTLGISRSSLYDTYGDKKKLFIKSLKRYIGTQSETLISSLSSSENAKESIYEIFTDLIKNNPDDNNQYGCLIVNTSIEFSCQETEIKDLIEKNNQKIIKALRFLIKKNQDNGKMSNQTNPEKIAQFIFNTIIGLRVNAKAGTSFEKMKNITDVALSVIY